MFLDGFDTCKHILALYIELSVGIFSVCYNYCIPVFADPFVCRLKLLNSTGNWVLPQPLSTYVFELVRDIINISILSKFYEDWVKIVGSRVVTRFNLYLT